MTIVYVTTGAWGTGTGAPNSAAQVDGNFYDVDQRIVDLIADLAEGKRIDTVTYTSNSMTFHFTDGTSQVIPLPVATLTYVGTWTNGTPYPRGNMITRRTTASIRCWKTIPRRRRRRRSIRMPRTGHRLIRSISSGCRCAMSTTTPRSSCPAASSAQPDELLFQGIANRTMKLAAGDAGAYAYLDVANTGRRHRHHPVDRKERNRDRHHHVCRRCAQVGTFNIPAATDFAEGDRYALRVTQSDNAAPSGLSVTLPFIRTDI